MSALNEPLPNAFGSIIANLDFEGGNIHIGTTSKGTNNILLGIDENENITTGQGNILIGKNASQYYANPSNKFYLDSTETLNPLLGGDFEDKVLNVGGFVEIDCLNEEMSLGDITIADNTISTTTGPLRLGGAALPPTAADSIASKGYVDSIMENRIILAPVQYASTTNLAGTYNNGTNGVGATLTLGAGLVIDGYTVLIGDVGMRILLKDQTDKSQNGIYTITSTTVLTRATDFDGNPSTEIRNGSYVLVESGDDNEGLGFTLATPALYLANSPYISTTNGSVEDQYWYQTTTTIIPNNDHNALDNLTVGDPHTQYVKKAGDTITGVMTTNSDIIASSAIGAPADFITNGLVKQNDLVVANRTDIYPDLNLKYRRWIPAKQNNNFNGHNFNKITYAPSINTAILTGRFYDNTPNELIYYSNNMSDWYPAVSGVVDFNWISICWSPDLEMFVVGGTNTSTFLYSYNGRNWYSTTTGTQTGRYEEIAWSPKLNLFVAVSSTNTIETGKQVAYSSDGISWQYATLDTTGISWRSICWSADRNIFLAVSDGPQVMYSSNGINWTIIPNVGVSLKRAIVWGSHVGLFVSVGNSFISYSRDGISWNNASLIASNYNSVAYSEDLQLFVAIIFSASWGPVGAQRLLFSKDGINWVISEQTMSNWAWDSVCYNSRMKSFVAVASILSGYDVIFYTTPFTDKPYRQIRNGEVQYYAMESVDLTSLENTAVSWVNAESGITNLTQYTCVAYSKELNLIVAGSADGYIIYSSDGLAWTEITSQVGKIIRDIIWVKELSLFIAATGVVGENVIYSSNGINWSVGNGMITDIIEKITWSDKLKKVYGLGSDSLYTSADGITWETAATTNPAGSPRDILYIKELDLIAILTSSSPFYYYGNGENNLISADVRDFTVSKRSIAWSSDKLIAIAVGDTGNNIGKISYSEDCIRWFPANISVEDTELRTVEYSPELGMFIARGNVNIYYSSNGIEWGKTADAVQRVWTSTVWNSKKGIFISVAIDADAPLNSVQRTSRSGTVVSSDTVFNSEFNYIDETGTWTYQKLRSDKLAAGTGTDALVYNAQFNSTTTNTGLSNFGTIISNKTNTLNAKTGLGFRVADINEIQQVKAGLIYNRTASNSRGDLYIVNNGTDSTADATIADVNMLINSAYNRSVKEFQTRYLNPSNLNGTNIINCIEMSASANNAKFLRFRSSADTNSVAGVMFANADSHAYAVNTSGDNLLFLRSSTGVANGQAHLLSHFAEIFRLTSSGPRTTNYLGSGTNLNLFTANNTTDSAGYIRMTSTGTTEIAGNSISLLADSTSGGTKTVTHSFGINSGLSRVTFNIGSTTSPYLNPGIDMFIPNTGLEAGGAGITVRRNNSTAVANMSYAGTSRDWRIRTPTAGGTLTDCLYINTNSLLAMAGTAANPAYSFIADSNTGIYNSVDGEISFSSNGTRLAYINGSGFNVNALQPADVSVAGGMNTILMGATTDSNRFIRFRQGGGASPVVGNFAGVMLSGFDSDHYAIHANNNVMKIRYSNSAGPNPTNATFNNIVDIVSTGIRMINGTVSNPSYSFIAETNTGFYREGTATTSYAALGVKQLSMSSSGLILKDGTAAAPSLSFFGGNAAGLYYTNNAVNVSVIGSRVATFSVGRFDLPEGTAGAPSITFGTVANGIYSESGNVNVSINAVKIATFNSQGLILKNSGGGPAPSLGFESSVDTGLAYKNNITYANQHTIEFIVNTVPKLAISEDNVRVITNNINWASAAVSAKTDAGISGNIRKSNNFIYIHDGISWSRTPLYRNVVQLTGYLSGTALNLAGAPASIPFTVNMRIIGTNKVEMQFVNDLQWRIENTGLPLLFNFDEVKDAGGYYPATRQFVRIPAGGRFVSTDYNSQYDMTLHLIQAGVSPSDTPSNLYGQNPRGPTSSGSGFNDGYIYIIFAGTVISWYLTVDNW
jgi:hypothetical protein